MHAAEEEVIRAVLTGDVDRYAELVDRYQAPAIRLAFSLLGNDEDARDAAQDAFVNAYRALGRFRGGATFSTWLFRIVINACKDLARRRAHQPRIAAGVGESDPASDGAGLFVDVADPTAGPSEQLANRELSRQLSDAIGVLPMKQRTAFLLRHVHGLSLTDTAEVMGCRVGTIKSHLFRATASLQRTLPPWVAPEGR